MLTSWAEKMVQRTPVKYQNTARQFLKFGVTGVIGAIVDFSVFNILVRGIGWDDVYFVFGYEVIAANLVSVALAIASNFLLNKYWTFRNDDKAVAKQGVQYFLLNFVTFVLNQILTSFFAFRLPIVELVFGAQKDNAAKALAIGLILFINFFGSKFLVFKKKKQGGDII